MKEKIKTWAFRLLSILIYLAVFVAVWLAILICGVGATVLFSKSTAACIITGMLAGFVMREISRLEDKINGRKK